MASAADKDPGAASADAPADASDDTPRVTRALPAIIDSAPNPPARVERLDAAPQDASERFAFALWGAGRKDEAVEFLERQIALHKTPGAAPTEAVPPAMRSPDMRSPGMLLDLAPTHVIAVPRPPIPKRPIVLAAAAIAAAVWFVWPGPERLAALPESVGLPRIALWAEEPTPPEAAPVAAPLAADLPGEALGEAGSPAGSTAPAPAPVVVAAREERGEDLPGEAVGEAGLPGEAPFEEVTGEDMTGEATPRVVVDIARNTSAPLEPLFTGSTAAAVSVPAAPESSEIDLAEADVPFEAEADLPIEADGDARVTLQTLAASVETETRLPRPRPEPSPQLVAALNAPGPAERAASAQQWRIVKPPVRPAAIEDGPLIVTDKPVAGVAPSAAPLVIAEPPLRAGPYGAAAASRGLTIIGRVTGPVYAVPRAATRYVTVRRARAAERAAIRRYGAAPVSTWSPQPALPWNAAPPSERWRYPPPPPVYDEPYYGNDEDAWYD